MYLRFQKIFALLLMCSSTLQVYGGTNKELYEPNGIKAGPVNFTYLGAFRFNTKTIGDSRVAYTPGVFTLSSDKKSLFIVGHSHHQAIAEYSIPNLNASIKLRELPFAEPKQNFTSILKTGRVKNKDKLNLITGMEDIEGELFVNAIEYYDADGRNGDTTFIVRDSKTLSKSRVDSFFGLQGRVHAAGWISSIPHNWRSRLSASYILGYANNTPINGRHSIGPSAFASNLDSFAGIDVKNGLIPTRPMLDYSLKHPINPDTFNKSGKNQIWTEVSQAVYGFILPGTDYYLVLGHSGGHRNKIGYKINQTNGNKCGGACPYNPSDYDNYYWIWDANDFQKVLEKKMEPYQPEPVSFGEFQLPFQPSSGAKKVIGADYDEQNQRLYLLLQSVDALQSEYEKAPIMIVLQINTK